MNDCCCVLRETFFQYLFCKISISKISMTIIIIEKYLNTRPFNFTWKKNLTVGDINFIGHRFVLWKMIILIKKGASDEHYFFSLWMKHCSTYKNWLIETLWWLTTYSHKFRKNFKIFTQFHLILYIGLTLNNIWKMLQIWNNGNNNAVMIMASIAQYCVAVVSIPWLHVPHKIRSPIKRWFQFHDISP